MSRVTCLRVCTSTTWYGTLANLIVFFLFLDNMVRTLTVFLKQE